MKNSAEIPDDVSCPRGVLRRVDDEAYDLYDRPGAVQRDCTPGDTMYVEPYLYTCGGNGRWRRSTVPMK